MAVLALLVFIAAFVAMAIFGFYGHNIRYGDPRLLWISVPIVLLYSFNSWKDRRHFSKDVFYHCLSLYCLPY
jgi:hypothetical protein